MVRVYKRKLGARRYRDYSTETLEECLESIRTGTFTQRKAAEHFNISRRTINHKLKQQHVKKPGKQAVFSRDEEETFVSYIEAMSDYGFPLTQQDLSYIVTCYLNKIDRKVKQFPNNIPGKDWMKSFVARYPRLKERFASNIKRSRAAVDEETVRAYIENLKDVVKDVPAENIWNLDETNLTDDPGKSRVICRRGTKYPEKVCNFSKSSISLMMCGSASGETLPPFVVYKATQLWNTWMEGGPKHCRYQSTKSGWFDALAFNDWFESLMLPKLKKLPRKKVLIADNLSTHLNINIFQKCRNENIEFICLPPNSTHLTQPLDVAFFRPMKVAWRKVLSDWKATPEGLGSSVLPKQYFPPLLKRVLEILEPNFKKTLESGFRKCGIYPCDVQPLLDRIAKKEVEPSAVSSAFLDALKSTRAACTSTGKPRLAKKKKINIPAGKSLSHDELVEMQLSSSEPTAKENASEPQPGTSQYSKSVRPSKKRKIWKSLEDSSEEEPLDERILDESSDEDWESFRKKAMGELTAPTRDEETLAVSKLQKELKPINKQVGAFVVVNYENEHYPGVIESFDEDGATVSAMMKSLNNWKWPVNKDELFYKWEEIVGGINPPKILSKRGIFSVLELAEGD